MRLASFGVAVAMVGCATVQPNVEPVWDGTEECFVRLMEPVRVRMRPKEFDQTYRNVLQGAVKIPLKGASEGTLAYLRSKGFFCGTLSRGGGLAGPEELQGSFRAAKVILFDEKGTPQYQIAQRPGDRFAVTDADGDRVTLELVRWSERCEGSRPPFLVIYRLSDLSATPMLAVTLNPEAGESSFTITEEEDGGWTMSRKYEPDRRGRWRFEKTPEGRNDVLIEEWLKDDFKVVARFILNDKGTKWVGPTGSRRDFWIDQEDPWVDASFLRFADLSPDRWFRGGNHGEIRDDVDHLKAAREAAREAGLIK